MNNGTYSFLDISATITGPGGAFDLGYGAAVAEEGISIEMAGDKNQMMIGADGTVMHSLHADKSGQVTVRLIKTSNVNQQLMALYDAQTTVGSGTLWGQNVIVIRNNRSGDVTTAQPCAFKRKPGINYRKDGDFLEWTFDAGQIDTVLGTYTN